MRTATLRLARAAAVTLQALLVTAAAGAQSSSAHPPVRYAAEPHVLRVGDNQEFGNLNPALTVSASLGMLSQVTSAYLVRYGKNDEPVPALATDVPTRANGGISKDGLTLTFHLRRGVRWSDGAPFDADDVVFSFGAMNNPKNDVSGRAGFDHIAQVDEPDRYTVVVHLLKPFAAFLPTFFGSAGANPALMPKHVLGDLPDINHAAYNDKPIGIGPFRYVEWIRGDHITVERNPYWYGPRPKLDKIVFKIVPDTNTGLTQMRTGELDVWPALRPGFFDQARTLPGVRVLRAPGYTYQHLDFNCSRPPLDDVVLRRALRLAVDRRTILEKGNHGAGTLQETWVSRASPWYEPVLTVPFDLRRANALLDRAGYARGTDGVRTRNGRRLAFDFAIGVGNPDIELQAELIRSTWRQLGIEIEVRRYSAGAFFGPASSGGILESGNFDVTDFSWQMSPDGAMSLYASRQLPPNGQNYVRYRNAAADAIFERLDASYDGPERKKLITAGVRQVVDDAPTVVLYVRDNLQAVNRAVTGWEPNGVTPFDNFEAVDVL